MAVTHDRDDYGAEPRFGFGPGPARGDSVSVTLRRAREDYGQDVRSIAQVLRIRQAYLEALESGQFDRLPGTTYALGFLRTYAEFLGLDGDEIVDRFKAEVEGAERRTELIFPEPVTEGRIPGGAVILISITLLGLAYGGWVYLSNQGRTVADLIPALPAQLEALLDTGGEDTATSAEAPAMQEPPAAATVPVAAVAEPPARPESAPQVASRPAETDAGTAEITEPTEQAATTVPEQTAAEIEEQPATAADSAPLMAEPAEPTAAVPVPPEAPAATMAPEPEPVTTQAPVEPESMAPGQAQAGQVTEPAPERETDAQLAGLGGGAGEYDVQTPPPAAPSAAESMPLVEQTVVIPSPPSAPESFGVPSDPTPRVYGESNESSRIVLRAVQDSWVQVRDRQDALLMTRVLRTGDVYHVPNQDGLTLLTGNAGGIQIEVDGVKLPPIGPVGAVRRQIALDPTRLLEGTAGAR